jgi:hypothetical protein
LTLDAINFGSGWFPHLRKRPGMSGYFTVAASLTDRFRRDGPFTAWALARITAEDCGDIFGQDRVNAPAWELMQHFAAALNQLGEYLLQSFDGSFTGLIEAAGHSAGRLVRLLAEMPYFADVQRYGDRRVAFYKRAQITPADLALAFAHDGFGRFDDIDDLTIFADNLVPHVLRIDGLLDYAPALAARIEAGALIPAGSPEEIEIRACGLHAVELLVAELRRQGRATTARELDYLLWNRGQDPAYKARPRHRTRTVYY